MMRRLGAVCIAVAAICWWIGTGAARVQGQSSGASFRVLSAEETGLGAIMQRWNAEELARQGGTFGSYGWWPWGVTSLDYDNDGDLDLLITFHGGPTHGMLIRNQFRETGTVTFVDGTQDVGLTTRDLPSADDKPVIWDFNGDGRLDVAGLGNEGGGSVSFFNRPNGRFQLAPFRFYPVVLVDGIADLNGDGYPDVWNVLRGSGVQYVRQDFLYQPRGETFTLRRSAYEPPTGVPEAIAEFVRTEASQSINRFLHILYLTDYDLNGDGMNDPILRGFASYGGSAFGRYCMSQSAGYCLDETVLRGLPEVGVPILIRDLNGDGHLDVLVAGGDAASGLYINNGFGRFTQMGGDLKRFLGAYDPYLHRSFPVDLDNDGDLDLIVSRPRRGGGEIHENIGTGDLFRLVKAFRGWDSNPIALGDLNLDGLIDVIVGGPGPTEVTVYLNDTPAPGNYSNIYPRMNAPNPFAVGARVEVFRAGTMSLPGTKPYFSEYAHPDGQPVHVGFGSASNFDLRVVFADGRVTQQSNVEATPRLTVTPDGNPSFRPPRLSPAGPATR